MNDLTQNIQELIKKQFHQSSFEVLDVVSLPSHPDRIARLNSLEDLLDELSDSASNQNEATFEYLLQIRPKNKKTPSQDLSQPTPAGSTEESIYLPTGKINVPFLTKNADVLFEAGEYALARNIHKTILKAGEQTGLSLYKLGRCFEAENKLEEARTHYEDSITFQASLEIYQRLSSLLIKQNRDQQAAEVMERAIHLKDLPPSTRFDLHKACGNCWTRAKNSENAENNFKRALELNPSADDIRANLGVLCLQENKINEAKRHFRDAIASNPKNYQALAGLGSCSISEGDKKAAHDYFKQSLDIELNNPTAVLYLVKCAYEIKSYAIAAKVLEDYTQITPLNANILYCLAGLQFHLGRLENAKSTTLKLLEFQAEHSGAKELLAMIEKFSGTSQK
jgi:Tfp pilus assembly protein PilF